MSLIAKLPNIAKPAVIAFPCSSGGGRRWQQFARNLGNRFSLVAPGLIGCGNRDHWTGDHAFTLSDEAALAVRIIDAIDAPVHLVGHSYGGAVAMRVAYERPTRVASLTLYEPAAFHILKTVGADGKIAFNEIRSVAHDIDRAVLSGAYSAAARRFVEYWSGEGSWAAVSPLAQAALVRYLPKACLEFRAAMGERTPLVAYRRFNFPTLLLQGEHASVPMRLIAWQLARSMRFTSLRTVYEAGHMGPVSHPEVVSAIVADHIVHAEPNLDASENDLAAPVRSAA